MRRTKGRKNYFDSDRRPGPRNELNLGICRPRGITGPLNPVTEHRRKAKSAEPKLRPRRNMASVNLMARRVLKFEKGNFSLIKALMDRALSFPLFFFLLGFEGTGEAGGGRLVRGRSEWVGG